MSSIQYTVSFPRAEAHLIDVTLELERPDPAGQCLTLPNWIPGSYMIRDFSRHVVALEASASGETVPLEKLDKSTWRAPAGLATLRVDYRVHAWDRSVRAAHVDRRHAFFNGTSVFLCPEDRENEPIGVVIACPAHAEAATWRVATAMDGAELDAAGFGRYTAADYDELIDHPVEIGTFTRLAFEAAGVPHEIVLSDHAPFDEGRLTDDLRRVCEHHVRFFGEPAPMARYVFLVTLVDAGYGGLEHRASTALLATRESLPVPGDARADAVGGGTDDAGVGGDGVGDENAGGEDEGGDDAGGKGEDGEGEGAGGDDDGRDRRGADPDEKYLEFLGLCSHEYFHTWNVKRIKPARFVPYALAEESYTRLLWFFEGVTSYYDDLALVRAGLIDRARYAELLGRTITRVRRGAGRLVQSVTDSSFDAWHKFYKQDENAANAIVSYYAKGALVALCLDARLREATGGEASLDTLMRTLWSRWLEDGAGLAEREPERLASEIAGTDLDDFFARALYSTEELPLESALETLGASLAWRARSGAKDRGGRVTDAQRAGSGERPPPWLGAALADAPGGASVVQVAARGPAERAGLAPGDRLVAIGHLAIGAGDIDAVLRRHAAAGEVVVHHFRAGRLLESRLPIERPPRDTAVVSVPGPEAPMPWLDPAAVPT